MKYKNEEFINEHYKLGEMESKIFFTQILGFHLLTDQIRRNIFIGGGKTIPFQLFMGFDPFKPDVVNGVEEGFL